jgi:hypothetical protein
MPAFYAGAMAGIDMAQEVVRREEVKQKEQNAEPSV